MVGLDIWVCRSSLANRNWSQKRATKAWPGASEGAGPDPARSAPLLAPQGPPPLGGYFWTFPHHHGLPLMFGFTMRTRAPRGTFQTFSLANSGPYFLSLHSEMYFQWGFSEILPLLSTLCISLQHGRRVDSQNFLSMWAQVFGRWTDLDLDFLKSVVWGWENFLDALLDGVSLVYLVGFILVRIGRNFCNPANTSLSFLDALKHFW